MKLTYKNHKQILPNVPVNKDLICFADGKKIGFIRGNEEDGFRFWDLNTRPEKTRSHKTLAACKKALSSRLNPKAKKAKEPEVEEVVEPVTEE